MFVRIPNQIIKYSCAINHMIVPVYLYSAVSSNPNNNYLIDTNLALISETFAPNEDSRKGIPAKIKDCISLLSDDVDDVSGVDTVDDIDEDSVAINSPTAKSKSGTIKGFSACLFSNLPSSVDKYTRIKYKFLFREQNMSNGFTMVSFEEYYYIIDAVAKINGQDNKMDCKLESKLDKLEKSENKKWNLIDLINFYCYLKMKISIFENLKKKDSKCCGVLRESIATMSYNLKVGNKTIAKYVNQLEKLGLIKVKVYKNQLNKSHEYHLSDDWKKKWEEILLDYDC